MSVYEVIRLAKTPQYAKHGSQYDEDQFHTIVKLDIIPNNER